jgi:hypothetical protein
VGAGAGWLGVRTATGSIRLSAPAPHPFANAPGFVRRLTPQQMEKVGKYVIVNAGLFLFFFFVAGTMIPAIIVAIFWGISLALEIWKSYVRGNRGRQASPAVEKVFKFLPTPLPDPPPAPPPAKPRLSALAVLSLLGSIPTLLAGLASLMFMIVMESEGRRSPLYAEQLRLAAFWTGAAAFLMAIPSLLMGTTASSLVREAQGILKGKGIAQAGVFLAILGAAVPVVAVKPRLSVVDRAGREAIGAAEQFVADLRRQNYVEARGVVSESVTEADLKSWTQEMLKRQVRWTAPQAQVSEGGARVRVRWQEEKGHDRFLDVFLRRDTRWRVSEVKFSPSKSGE